MLLSVLLTGTVSAQVSTISKKDGADKVIDHAKYRITYMLKDAVDTTAETPRQHADEMRLDVGPVASIFYSRTKQVEDSMVIAQLNAGSYSFGSTPRNSGVNWTFYSNYPEGKTTFCMPHFHDQYRVEEPLATPDWTMVSDSVATILGHECFLATCHLGGRDWSAWYTTDIPLSYGPYKFSGLPGLVLRAYDSERAYTFDCMGMEEVKGNVPITWSFDDYEPVTWKELYKAFGAGFQLPGGANVNVKMYDKDGNEITGDAKKEMLKKQQKALMHHEDLIERVK